jgi:uncharacterized membrane protein
MDGIILLVIIVPVVLLFLLISIHIRSGEQRELLDSLHDKINRLTKEVTTLSKELKATKPEIAEPQVSEKPVPVYTPEKPVEQEKSITAPEPVKPFIPSPIPAKPVPVDETEAMLTPVAAPATGPKPEQEKDIEKFIGENLANKAGITVLVLGIAFFVKYAIDKNWINEAGRVIVGILSGSILTGFAHYYRNTYRSFSSVLVGGGLTVFYFSIAFAFHQYHLIGQLQAFIYMVVVSGFAVGLSLYYNRQELAILATIGGFITPFLVSTGQSNYMALFTYLCILNTALTALSWFKRWPAINIISLFFTTFIYSGWLLFSAHRINEFPVTNALLFATLFYLLFVTMNIINSIRLKITFTAFYFIILLSIHFLYYAAGMYVLDYGGYAANGKGMFTLSLGLFTLLLTGLFYRRKEVDRNFVSLLMGLSLTFISLTAPVWFRGNHITLFWIAEAVLLYYLYSRTRIVLLKLGAGIILLVMLFSLLLTWVGVYLQETVPVPVLFNKGFITGLIAAAGLFLFYRMLRKEKEPEFITGFSNSFAGNFLLVLAAVILYLSGVLELNYQLRLAYPQLPVYTTYLQLYTFSFAVVMLFLFRSTKIFPLLKILLTVFCLAMYCYYINAGFRVSQAAIEGTLAGTHFIAHWASVLLLGWLLYDLIRYFFSQQVEDWQEYRVVFTWLSAIAIVMLLSIELYNVLKWISYTDAKDWAWWENLYYKAGLSICWSVCSFTMMWMGMKYRFRTLRIISLSLFSITLVKLFTVDIRNIPPGGKIAAFILLGILLLVVSFMYQRLKKMIIEDNPTNNRS